MFDKVLTQAEVATHHVTPVVDLQANVVSAYECEDKFHPTTWADVITGSGNDFTFTGGVTRRTGCTPGCIQRLVYELATEYSAADSTEIDLTDSWLIPTDPMSAILPRDEATPLEIIDSLRWGASASFVFDTTAGAWKLYQIVDSAAATADITIEAYEIIEYTPGASGQPVHAVTVGYQPVGLVQLPGDIPAATAERVVLVGVPQRYATPAVIAGNALAYPQAEPLVRISGAWYLEASAATEALRVAGIIGTTERSASLTIGCPITLLPSGKVLKLNSPRVEGGVKRSTVVSSSGDGKQRTYRLKA